MPEGGDLRLDERIERRAGNAQRSIHGATAGRRRAERAEQIAERHGVEVAQVVLRWHVQLGALPIPKSASPDRQRLNLDIFHFELSESEMSQISALERGRQSHDPDTHEEF